MNTVCSYYNLSSGFQYNNKFIDGLYLGINSETK